MKYHKIFIALITAIACQACQCSREFCTPTTMCGIAPQSIAHTLPKPFPSISQEEMATDYGKELKMAEVFSQEGDFYRAITCFRRALILLPANETQRIQDAEFGIVLCYYQAHKFDECLNAFQNSQLIQLSPDSPLYRELLVILYDCYNKLGQPEAARLLLDTLKKKDSLTAKKLEMGTLIEKGHMIEAADLKIAPSYLNDLIDCYCKEQKSVTTAKALNAVLPGAGYWYVGQKTTAITALIVNGLFTWAAYQFFHRGFIAAGIFTASLETGWYFGGIMGAGSAACEYNQHLYNEMGEKVFVQEKLYPVLMLNYSF